MRILYMDASGDPGEYCPGTGKGSNSSYYVLCGLACQPQQIQEIGKQFDAIVRTHFRSVQVDPPEKLHYWELIANRKPYDKINRKRLADDVFNLVIDNKIDLLGIVFNKEQCKRRPIVDHTLEAMTMRFQTYLEKHKELGMIISDREDEHVQTSLRFLFQRFKKEGTRFKKIQNIIDGLYFAPSGNAPCLQLADFCGYAVRCSYERGDGDRLSQIVNRFKNSGGIRELP